MQAVLPGEDPAEFEAHRDALFDDWRPMSCTCPARRAALAIASWRLRFAVTSESASAPAPPTTPSAPSTTSRRRRRPASRRPLRGRPRRRPHPAPVQGPRHRPPARRLGRAGRALEGGPAGWSQRYHRRLMQLLGHPDGTDLITAGLLPIASAAAGGRASPASSAAGGRGGGVGRRPPTAGGPGHRPAPGTPAGGAPDHSGDRRRAAEAASGDVTAEAQLRHRYEMALDRSLRGTIYQLIALERSGADLAGPDPAAGTAAVPGGTAVAAELPGGTAAAAEVEAPPADPASGAEANPALAASAPGSVSAGGAGLVPNPPDAPPHGPRPPIRAAEAAGWGGSPR